MLRDCPNCGADNMFLFDYDKEVVICQNCMEVWSFEEYNLLNELQSKLDKRGE